MTRTNALHFEIHTNNSKPYGYIRISYRQDRKIKHDTIARIPGCTLEQFQAMKAAFNGTIADNPTSSADIKIESGRVLFSKNLPQGILPMVVQCYMILRVAICRVNILITIM